MTLATTTISGLISGLDTATIIQQLMSIERRPLDKLQQQVDTANQQKQAFTTINTSLLALKTVMDDLSRGDTWNSKTASVSDAKVLTATATSATPAGSYVFTVQQLAAASQLASNGYADPDTALVGAGTFDLTMGTNTQTLTVGASDTLDDVAATINARNMGVSAVVVNTGQGASPYRLILSSTQTGTANAASFANHGSGLAFSDLTIARNSIIEFGATAPIQIESATNTVTGLAPGLTLDLQAASAAPVTVTVGTDNAGLLQKAQDFVTKYNTVADNLATYDKYDADKMQASVLFGNSTLRNLEMDLAMAVSTVVSGLPAQTNSLPMVGFKLDGSGKLSLDQSVFSAALKAYPAGVAGLFSAITDSALGANGAGISTAAVPDSGFAVNNLINGDTDSDNFGPANGFQTATPSPSFTVDFGQTRQISQLVLDTINSLAMPAASYGVSDFSFELQSPDGAWQTVKTVTGSTAGKYIYNLDLPMAAKALRVTVTATNAADGKTRLVELGANEESGVAHRVSNLLTFVTRGVDGQIATEQSGLDARISALQEQMDDLQERLDAKQARLQQEFTNMEMALAQMQAQSQQFLAQLGSTSSSK